MRLVLVEDQVMMRDFVRAVCRNEPDIEVVAEAGTGSEAVDKIITSKPDAVMLDLSLPDFDGIEVLNRIRAHGDRPRVLVLSGYRSPYLMFRLERIGIDAFVDKCDQTEETLRGALAAIRTNKHYFSKTYSESRRTRLNDPFSFDKLLTDQQMMVLSLVAHHLDDTAIAKYLGISERTVEAHRTSIMRKLDTHSRTDLIRVANNLGFAIGSPPCVRKTQLS